MANYGKRLGYPLRFAGVGVNKLLALLAVLLVFTHSWADCVPFTRGSVEFGVSWCQGGRPDSPTYHKTLCENAGYVEVWDNSRFCYVSVGSSQSWCSGDTYVECAPSTGTCCRTQPELDSAKCEINPSAEGCGNCKAADSTWLSFAIDSCDAIYGENNYSIVDTNDVCEHRGHCCPMDSTIAGNVCSWKCESAASQCQPPLHFYSSILLDTTASDTGDVVQGRCYYNCINYVPSDTTKAMVSGNILLAGPVSAMSQGTKVPNAFNSVRITDNDTYIYDYLFPQAEHYLDSIAFTPCVQALYRGVLNGKYVYWYDNQPVPAGVTNIVKIK